MTQHKTKGANPRYAVISPRVHYKQQVAFLASSFFCASVYSDKNIGCDDAECNDRSAVKKSGISVGENVGENSLLTISGMAFAIGVSERSIERNLKNLQDEKHLRRVGAAKGGRWEISE